MSLRPLPLVLVIAAAGCDRVFELDEIELGVDASEGADGNDGSTRPAICENAAIYDTFDDSTPCTFGAINEPLWLDQHDGVLDIRVPGDVASYGGCSTFQPLPFTENGVFVHVIRPLITEKAYTTLVVRDAMDQGTLNATLGYSGDQLKLTVNGTDIAILSGMPPWWRIRREATGVAADISEDGSTWTLLGSATASLPPSIDVDFGAGIFATPVASATAIFGEFGVCE